MKNSYWHTSFSFAKGNVPWHFVHLARLLATTYIFAQVTQNNCGAKESLHRRIDSSLFDFSTKRGTMQTLYLVKVYVSITISTTFFSFKSNVRETWRVILVSRS